MRSTLRSCFRQLLTAAMTIAAGTACEQGKAETRPLVVGGHPEAGRAAIRRYGCGSCHTIPGIKRADGLTGPPLTAWSDRKYIAGALLNEPRNLIYWIMFPEAVEPGTAMPTLGVTPADARDIAAYLYTLGDAEVGPPHPISADALHRLMPMHARRPK